MNNFINIALAHIGETNESNMHHGFGMMGSNWGWFGVVSGWIFMILFWTLLVLAIIALAKWILKDSKNNNDKR